MKLRTEQPLHHEIALHESGWWAPAQVGGSMSRWQQSAIEHLEVALRHANGRQVAVQAGSHIGVWPVELSRHFRHVHTFEADKVNRDCAMRNIYGLNRANVTLHPEALGAEAGEIGWYRSISNSGKHKPASPMPLWNRKGFIHGTVPVITLDSLELVECDLLCLDVEGFELPALQGAERTIREFRPAILVEELGHGAFHGLTPGGVAHWLLDHGYREVEQIDDDHIWVPA